MTWHISQWFIPSFPHQKHKGIFLQYLMQEPGPAPEGKSHKSMDPHDWVHLKSLTLRLVYIVPQQLINYISSFPALALILSEVSDHSFLLG